MIHHGGRDGDWEMVRAVSIGGVAGLGFFALDQEEPPGTVVKPDVSAVLVGVGEPTVVEWPLVRRR